MMISRTKSAQDCILSGALALLMGCEGTPELGTGKSVVTGSAGEAGAQVATTTLAHCEKPLGKASLVEPSADAMLVLCLGPMESEQPAPPNRLVGG